jgi:hypothetical protein
MELRQTARPIVGLQRSCLSSANWPEDVVIIADKFGMRQPGSFAPVLFMY